MNDLQRTREILDRAPGKPRARKELDDRTGMFLMGYRPPVTDGGLRPTLEATRPATRVPWSARVLRRVRDSKVAHWAVGYIAFAYGGVELLDNLSELWSWSVAFQKTAVLLLACGLPPVLVLSWFHGEKGRQEMCAAEAVILTVLLLLALVVVRVSSGAV